MVMILESETGDVPKAKSTKSEPWEGKVEEKIIGGEERATRWMRCG